MSHREPIENQKPGFSLVKAFLALQNTQKATIRLIQRTKNLVSLHQTLFRRCFNEPQRANPYPNCR